MYTHTHTLMYTHTHTHIHTHAARGHTAHAAHTQHTHSTSNVRVHNKYTQITSTQHRRREKCIERERDREREVDVESVKTSAFARVCTGACIVSKSANVHNNNQFLSCDSFAWALRSPLPEHSFPGFRSICLVIAIKFALTTQNIINCA